MHAKDGMNGGATPHRWRTSSGWLSLTMAVAVCGAGCGALGWRDKVLARVLAPDGTSVAVCQEVPAFDGPDYEVRLEGPDGTRLRRLYRIGDGDPCSEVAWSPGRPCAGGVDVPCQADSFRGHRVGSRTSRHRDPSLVVAGSRSGSRGSSHLWQRPTIRRAAEGGTGAVRPQNGRSALRHARAGQAVRHPDAHRDRTPVVGDCDDERPTQPPTVA